MSKRGARVPAPATGGQWELRFADKRAGDNWEKLCNTAPGNCAAMHRALTENPRGSANRRRHHQLRGELSTARHRGKVLEQWQYEITGSGRVWFLIDDDRRTVWLTVVEAGHPSRTEK